MIGACVGLCRSSIGLLAVCHTHSFVTPTLYSLSLSLSLPSCLPCCSFLFYLPPSSPPPSPLSPPSLSSLPSVSFSASLSPIVCWSACLKPCMSKLYICLLNSRIKRGQVLYNVTSLSLSISELRTPL